MTSTPRPTKAQIKAMAYALADEIETRAQKLIAAGIPRDTAMAKTIEAMASKTKG